MTRGVASNSRCRGRGIGGIQSLCAGLPDSAAGPELGVELGWVDVIALLDGRRGLDAPAVWSQSRARKWLVRRPRER